MASNGKGAAKGKGKAVAAKGSSGKRKRDDDKTGGRKKRNPAVLQFFEDSAAEASDYDTSDFEEDFPDDDDDDEELKKPGEPHKSQKAPVKEEELSGDELERVLEERYKSGSGYVRYAEDDYETKRVDKNFGVPSAPEPVIWKVKCKVGRERQTIFCLMQKFADLKALGTKLQIVSAFSVEHVRGFIFVEANKQFEVMEACKQLPDVYYSMIAHVPSSEFSQMLAVRKKKTEVSKGMWVRVKSGNYKGDLAQVVAVGDSRKKATLKLIPRVDFQALAAKFGAGSSIKRTAVPKPRLIASSDLEEFRPLIQSRRDRDTGMHFEVLDGLMLKDGYLYKKVSVDSLRICDVNPSIEELQKFRTSNNEDSGNVEFLSQLYGNKKETPTMKPVQVGGKGEGTSGSKEQEDIEVHDLVLFGKREFGMVIGMEKDESYKILKYGLEGSAVVSLSKKDFKNLSLEKKFNALDHRMKTIFANDVVKILDGPLKDKEGIVKQIYRGIIFLYDQNDMEDNVYFCAKSQSCEKVKHNDDICLGKNGEAGPSGCDDLPSSPKTPLSPEKSWQTEEQSRNFNRREQQDGEFSVGQSLRIRVGPLKGYLCRVLAVRRSDVTVKLDSRQKVLTVKSEHLSEVRGKSFATSTCDDTGLDSSRPFDFLGNNAGGNDWMASSVQNNDNNEEGQSTEGSSWPAFTSSAPSLPWGASSGDTSAPTEDDPWQKKPSTTLEGGSSWGQQVKTDIPSVPQNDTSSSWDKGKNVTDGTSSWGDGGSDWGQEVKTDIPSIPQKDASSSWDKGKNVIGGTSSWGNLASEKDNEKGSNDSAKQWASEPSGSAGWGQQKGSNDSAKQWASEPSGSAGWGQQKSSENTGSASQNSWDQSKNSQDKGTNPTQDSWGKVAGETWGSKCDPSGTKDWTNPAPAADSQNGGWGAGGASNQADANNWGKPKSSSGGASWSKSDLKQQDGSTQNEGWTVGGGSGEGSSGAAAWDNGNSGSSGWGQQKSWGKSSEMGTTTEGASEGKWGNFKVGDTSDRQQDNWKKPNPSGAEGGAPSWGNSSGNDAWGQSSRSDNDQGFGGGRGFGGRRGRGNGGRFDQSGRGRGRSFGRGQFSSWNKEGQDEPSSDRGTGYGDAGSSDKSWSSGKGSWGNSSGRNHNQGGSSGEGKTWNNDQGWNAGKEASDQDTPSGWKQGGSTQNMFIERSSELAAGWNSGSSGWGQQKLSEGTTDGSSTWGKATEESQGKDAGAWGSAVDSWAKKSCSSEAKEWKSSSDGSGVKSGGWGDSSGKWGTQKDNVSSWNASTGNDSWGQLNSYGNNQGRSGGRGDYGGRGDFGGRRGRGGFRGGRDQPGRGRGGRSFGGRQSWNNEGEDKPSWGGSSGGGNYNQGGGWGNNNQGGGGSSGGWAKEKGGGGSWGNDKGGSAGGGWGTSSGKSNQGGNGGGGGGWGNNDKGGSDGGGGWGTSGVTNGEGSNGGGSGWGSSSSGKASTGGWGGSSAGTKGDEGGGSGWGKTKVVDAGSGGWGKPPSGRSGAGGEEKATGAGGGSGGSGSAGTGNGGWGNSSPGKSEAGGEKDTGGCGGGWGGGNKDQGSGGGGGW